MIDDDLTIALSLSLCFILVFIIHYLYWEWSLEVVTELSQTLAARDELNVREAILGAQWICRRSAQTR